MTQRHPRAGTCSFAFTHRHNTKGHTVPVLYRSTTVPDRPDAALRHNGNSRAGTVRGYTVWAVGAEAHVGAAAGVVETYVAAAQHPEALAVGVRCMALCVQDRLSVS